jgi:hypothetical protein
MGMKMVRVIDYNLREVVVWHGDWASDASTLTAISDTDVNTVQLPDRDLPSILSRDIAATSSMSGFAVFSR